MACLPLAGTAAGWGGALLFEASGWRAELRVADPRLFRLVDRVFEIVMFSTVGLVPYLVVLAWVCWAAGRWPWPRLGRALWLVPPAHALLTLAFVELALGDLLVRDIPVAHQVQRAGAILLWVTVFGYGYVALGRLGLRVVYGDWFSTARRTTSAAEQ